MLTQNELNLRKRRWLELFKDCDYIVDYHQGKANVVANALSRKTISVLSLKHCIWKFTSEGALFAQLKAMADLKQIMIDAQKNEVKLQQIIQLVGNGDKTNYSIKRDGGLYYKNRLCVPKVQEMKKKLMYESHNTVFTMLEMV